MPVHRLALFFALITLLGMIAVTLQIRGVQLGYRVTREEACRSKLREVIREAELQVHRRRDPADLWERSRAFGAAPEISAAGRVVLVTGCAIAAAPRETGTRAPMASR
jgi:adenylylsulfate kinase-like enzyme